MYNVILRSFVMMSWNHRVVKREYEDKITFSIHEVIYDEQGAIQSCTDTPVPVSEESVNDLDITLKRMLQATLEPVLDYHKDIPGNDLNEPTQLALDMFR